MHAGARRVYGHSERLGQAGLDDRHAVRAEGRRAQGCPRDGVATRRAVSEGKIESEIEASSMIPKSLPPDVIRGWNRCSEKIVLKQEARLSFNAESFSDQVEPATLFCRAYLRFPVTLRCSPDLFRPGEPRRATAPSVLYWASCNFRGRILRGPRMHASSAKGERRTMRGRLRMTEIVQHVRPSTARGSM